MKKLFFCLTALMLLLTGCASVPMADRTQSDALKQFKAPAENQVGIYVYRDSVFGAALKKNLYLDGQFIGQSAPRTFLYVLAEPGTHRLETESEFGNNGLNFIAQGGKNYFFRQYIKMGVFIGGANLKEVSEERARRDMQNTHLAQPSAPYRHTPAAKPSAVLP